MKQLSYIFYFHMKIVLFWIVLLESCNYSWIPIVLSAQLVLDKKTWFCNLQDVLLLLGTFSFVFQLVKMEESFHMIFLCPAHNFQCIGQFWLGVVSSRVTMLAVWFPKDTYFMISLSLLRLEVVFCVGGQLKTGLWWSH